MLNEAALETVRRRGEQVSTADIYNGMDRILQVLASLWLSTHADIRADSAESGWPEQELSPRSHSLHSVNVIWLCSARSAWTLACQGDLAYMLNIHRRACSAALI